MSYITFPCIQEDESIHSIIYNYTALVQKLINMTLQYRHVIVERLSFVDYTNMKISDSFHIGKQLCIHNTSTLETFGHGRYNGYFFDVIVRLPDNNPMNIRIFYGIVNPHIKIENPQIENNEINVQTSPDTHMMILGEYRKFFKRGRTTYIEYNDKMITLSEAKKLEKINT